MCSHGLAGGSWTSPRAHQFCPHKSEVRSDCACSTSRNIIGFPMDTKLSDFLNTMGRLADENALQFDVEHDPAALNAISDRSDLLIALWREPATAYGISLMPLKGLGDVLRAPSSTDVRTSAVWCSGRDMALSLALRLWDESAQPTNIN